MHPGNPLIGVFPGRSGRASLAVGCSELFFMRIQRSLEAESPARRQYTVPGLFFLHHRLHRGQQCIFAKWFRQKAHRSAAQRVSTSTRIAASCDEDNRDPPIGCGQLMLQLEPVHPRHHHIEDQTRGLRQMSRLHELGCGRESLAREAHRSEQACQRDSNGLVVVHDRYERFGLAAPGPLSRICGVLLHATKVPPERARNLLYVGIDRSPLGMRGITCAIAFRTFIQSSCGI